MKLAVAGTRKSRRSEAALPLKSNFVEKAYAHVRDRILNSILGPGESIRDKEVAAALGISRTPVREALRRLELEGIVNHTPHRGWTVRILQVSDIAELFEIKEHLEGMLVRQATMNLTAEEKTILMRAMSNMEEAADRRDLEAWLAADRYLEDTLYGTGTNARARQIVSSLNAQWRWIWLRLISLEDRMNQSAREHRDILDRVLAGDAERAAIRMTEHLAGVKRYLLNLLTNFVLPLTERLAGTGGASMSSLAETQS